MHKTLGALVVFAGLLAALFYVRSRPEKGLPAARPRPVPVVSADQVDKIEVVKDGEKVVLARVDQDKFRVAEPVDFPADDYAVKQILDRLAKLDFSGVVTDKADRHAEFEVDDAKGVKVKAWDKAGKLLADFVVGKVATGQTMIRAAGKNEVHGAIGTLKYIFAKDLRNWRDKAVLDFKKEDVTGIELTGPAGAIALARKDENAWEVKSSTTPIDALDESVPAGILSSAAALRASEFADGVALADAGLAPPLGTLTFTFKDGAKKQLHHGKTEGEDTRVKTPDRDQVFVLKKYTTERLFPPPIDFRDKTIAKFSEDDAVELEIVKGGAKLLLRKEAGAWKATPAVEPLDEAKVKNALSGLATLKAARYSPEPQAAAFAKPAGSLRIKLKDQTQIVLTISALQQDGTNKEHFLRRAGRADTFVVKEYTVTRFLKTGDDFKKSDKPSAGPMPSFDLPPG